MFKVEIMESGKEITSVKERVMLKDTRDAIRLDEATKEGSVIINPVNYAILKVENDRSEDKSYNQYLIIDANGTKYLTGSEAFFSAFVNFFEEMSGSGEEWGVKAYRVPSKNFVGRDFLSCSIV